jgi:hypothetical protein
MSVCHLPQQVLVKTHVIFEFIDNLDKVIILAKELRRRRLVLESIHATILQEGSIKECGSLAHVTRSLSICQPHLHEPFKVLKDELVTSEVDKVPLKHLSMHGWYSRAFERLKLDSLSLNWLNFDAGLPRLRHVDYLTTSLGLFKKLAPICKPSRVAISLTNVYLKQAWNDSINTIKQNDLHISDINFMVLSEQCQAICLADVLNSCNFIKDQSYRVNCEILCRVRKDKLKRSSDC